MPDAIATIEQTLGGKVDYAVSLEPERTMLCIDMIVKSSDKTENRAINIVKSSDKTRDEIEKLGIT